MPDEMKLGDYLFRLVLSSELRARYQTDPKTELENSGLNEYKQGIMLGGDLTEILNQLAEEYGIKPGDHFAI